MSEPHAIVDDVFAAGFCARGLRAWAARHGIRITRSGVPIAVLEQSDDPLAHKVAECARERLKAQADG